jgi:hypothetical protein
MSPNGKTAMTDTRHLVIVGGGTAGWMTAASLAQALPRGSWSITLVESPEIGIIGVGEGSFPTLRNTIARLGQGLPGGDERSFMRAARATFKQGVRFVGWAGQPTPGSQSDDYFHPFDLPRDNFDERLLPCWLDSGVDPRRPSWAGSISVQEAVIHAGRRPNARRTRISPARSIMPITSMPPRWRHGCARWRRRAGCSASKPPSLRPA